MSKQERISQEEELIALRAKVEQLEREKESNSSDKYLKEIQDLKKAQQQGVDNIKFKPIHEKLISLWHVSGHNIGKRVGPIHPGGAEDVFLQFSSVGIKLSMTKPTEAEIEAYKKTKEYKAAEEKEIKRRAAKNRSRGSNQIEKLTEAIAKSQGIRMDQVNRIKSQEEVGIK